MVSGRAVSSVEVGRHLEVGGAVARCRDLHGTAHREPHAMARPVAQLEPAYVAPTTGLLWPDVGHEEVVDGHPPATDQAGAFAVGIALVRTKAEPLRVDQTRAELEDRARLVADPEAPGG